MEDNFEKLYHRIQEDIRSAVAPAFIQLSIDGQELVSLAIEIWRIERRLKRLSGSIPDTEKNGFEQSMLKLSRYLTKHDIETIDHTGQSYNDGLNFDVISVERDPTNPVPTVKETLEPTVMCKGRVVKRAKVIVARD